MIVYCALAKKQHLCSFSVVPRKLLKYKQCALHKVTDMLPRQVKIHLTPRYSTDYFCMISSFLQNRKKISLKKKVV